MTTVVDKPTTTALEIEHQHYAEIREKTNEICTLRTKYVAAKDKAKNAKNEFDCANAELIELIKNGPDLQRNLPFDGEADMAHTSQAQSDAWRSVTLDHLDIKPGLVTKLAEHQLETLGQLSDFWKKRRVLTDLAGIGESKDEAVRDAFSKYGREHPEVFGGQPEQATTEAQPEGNDDSDFDDEEFDDDEEIYDDFDDDDL